MQGIYKIENLKNGRVYIGHSRNVEQRWYKHTTMLNHHWHFSSELQSDFDKYGKENFSYQLIENLEDCDDENYFIEREQYWIEYYGGCASSSTYNTIDADFSGGMPQNVRDKISEALIGNIPWNKGLTADTDERVAKYSSKSVTYFKVNRHTEEVKKKISESVKQKHREGAYNYDEIVKKSNATRLKNGTIRKDKGVKRGLRDPEIGKRISEAKLAANQRKRELGLPLKNQEKKPIPMKTTVCCVCGKEFQQRRCHNKKTCSYECRNMLISVNNKKNNIKLENR